MKKISFFVVTALFLVACGGNPNVESGASDDIMEKESPSNNGGASMKSPSQDDEDDNMPSLVIDVPIDPEEGTGGASEDQAAGGAPSEEGCEPVLNGTIHDFIQANMPADQIPDGITPHPDFEWSWGSPEAETGIVESLLDNERKPVYAHPDGTTLSTNGKVAFDQWFHDDPTVNRSIPVQLQLTEMADGKFVYDNQEFFPIDDQLFGASWDLNGDYATNPVLAAHNYHFTLELHTRFTYRKGDTFLFRGDDDVFVFINGKLAIDLGGVHQALTGEIALDTEAERLGIEIGGEYTLDFFFAERHLWHSTFRIETTLAVCEPPTVTEKPPVIIK